MDQPSPSALNDRLKAIACDVVDPNTSKPLGAAVNALSYREGRVAVDVLLGYMAGADEQTIERAVTEALIAEAGVNAVTVEVRSAVVSHAVQNGLAPLDGVKNIIAVASGKGGVGKSTVAVGLALTLQNQGAKVGILDADIYGPSLPRMLGMSGQPEVPEKNRITPMEVMGLQAMSIGVLVNPDQAMIWRGPMATQALQQMLTQTHWQGLDYLILDLPPGTGDIQLTLAQRVPVAGAVVVTTPQQVALDDVRRAVAMFQKVNIPVLGVVENMSTYICPHCGEEEALFGQGGGQEVCEEMAVPLLGQLPLNPEFGRAIDQGRSLFADSPEHLLSIRFDEIARGVAARLALQARNRQVRMPKIKIVE